MISFGVESGSEKILRTVKKKMNLDDIIKTFLNKNPKYRSNLAEVYRTASQLMESMEKEQVEE